MLLLHPHEELPRLTRWLMAGLGQLQQQLALQQAPAGVANVTRESHWSPAQVGLYSMAAATAQAATAAAAAAAAKVHCD